MDKQPDRYLIAFDDTHVAIHTEKLVQEAGCKARLVGTPESISASCGLALLVKYEEMAKVWDLVQEHQLIEEVAPYCVYRTGAHKTYEPYQPKED